MNPRFCRPAHWIVAAAILFGCATPPSAQPTLYERMGGAPAVARVVDDLIDHTAADPRTKRSFKESNITRVKEKLREQICVLAAGPCNYTGDPMIQVHRPLKVTEAEFYLMVQFLRDALDRAGVHEAEKNELLRLLAPMKPEIVFG